MDLADTQKHVAALRGETLAVTTMLASIVAALPDAQFSATMREFDTRIEAARVFLLNSAQIGDVGIESFENAAQFLKLKG